MWPILGHMGFAVTRAHRKKRRAVVLRLVFGCAMACAGLASQRAWAGDAGLDVSQYAHTAWKVHDGFVKGQILSIAQTPDGYLWLGTDFSLYRFDGVRAVPWQPPNGEQLPSNAIFTLLVARDGTLWIGTLKGLASWNDGKLVEYPEVAGQILSLLQDREGTVWVGTAPSGLCAIEGGKAQCYRGDFGPFVSALYEDSRGNLWVSAAAGLWRWKPAPPLRYWLPAGVTGDALIEGDSGALLLATVKGLKQLAGGKIQDFAIPGVSSHLRPNHFFRELDGSLWISSLEGLLHVHGGKTDAFRAADGLSGDNVNSIFKDREGNVWVTTTEGLDRFREYAVPKISKNQGLSTSYGDSVQAMADGTIWMSMQNGLNRWWGGRVTVYGRSIAGGERRTVEAEPDIGKSAVRIENGGLEGVPRSLGLDDRGRLWVSTTDGVFYLEGKRFLRVPGVAGGNVYGIGGDAHGKVWISNSKLGLYSLAPEGAVQKTPWSRFGQKPFGARTLLGDLSHGGVWLGFYEGGLFYFNDGQVRASYTAADGLGNGSVNDLRFGSRGALWSATEGGLSRIRDGHVMTLTSKNGLPCDTVHWSEEDDDHFVWVYMPCGLARIASSELDAWVSDSSRKLKLTVFDNSDGVASIGVYGSVGPHVTKAADGKIWFAQKDGLGVIDPRHLPYNKIPPPVYIEQIRADGKIFHPMQGSELPPRIQHLDIDYTALSLVAPEKNRFRIRLEGYDRDWRDVGDRRQAFYTNLPPRNYRFRVIACNNSGLWNEEGASLDFSIAPAYYQTNWFRALCVAALLALLWALHVFRLQQLQQRFNAGLEARVNERTRIARELHDTLLQSFQGLLMRFQAVSNELTEGEPKQELDETIDRAARAITEGRDAVQGLRSSALERNDLAAALGALGKELAAADNRRPEFTIQVEGAHRHLHPIVRDEVYSVAGEALRNAFRHANAQHIEVEIRYDERQFRLRVRDDGKGIDSQLLMEHGRPGHFGLRGMNERAKQAGGRLSVWSSDPRPGGALESGTEVELRIPAAHAYGSYHAPRRRWWLAEKFSGKDYEMKS